MNTCILESGAFTLTLSGLNADPLIWRVRRGEPEPTPDGNIAEKIDLALETDGSLTALPRLVECILARARAGRPSWIRLEAPDGELFRSPLLDGSLSFRGRGLRSTVVRLSLVRAAYWEGELAALPLSGASGITAETQVIRFRSDQPGPANWVTPVLGGSQSALPLPLVIEIANDRPGAQPLAGLHLFSAPDLAGLAGSHWLEGELALSGTTLLADPVPDPGCSGGAYLAAEWDASPPGSRYLLAAWELPAVLQNALAGRPARPLLRLTAPADGSVWASWRVMSAANAVLACSEPVLLEEGSRLHLLPALPFEGYQARTSLGQWLEVWIESQTAGSLGLDGLQILPCEQQRRYVPLGAGVLPPGWALVDDEVDAHALLARDGVTGLRRTTHRVEGAPVVLWPGSGQKLFLAWSQPDGASLDAELSLRVLARMRRVTL